MGTMGQKSAKRSIAFYAFVIIITILYVFVIYFKKFNITEKIINIIRKSENDIACNPFNNISNLFQISIDNEIYPKFTPLFNNSKYNFSCLNKNKSKKLILYWNKWFGDPNFNYGIGKSEPFIKNKCPVTNCEITNDHSRVTESDIILFHMRDNIPELPSFRTSNQRWIFYLFESPVHSANFKKYENLFNLSSTYKANSNFTSPYFSNTYYMWTQNSNFDSNKDYTKGKTEFAVIIVSNCHDRSGRLKYVKELQKTIPVTIYGKCGKSCPVVGNNTKIYCKEFVSKTYKFYFAFENSICSNYVTEKFFIILRYDIIPVVYGDGDYSKYVPQSGYINAFDYPTPKHLADYLIYLDGNKTAYNSYFKWKKYVKFIENGPYYAMMCEFCIQLNLDLYEGIKTHVISDMNKFWSSGTDCNNICMKNFTKCKNDITS